jgi:hypothetical protein
MGATRLSADRGGAVSPAAPDGQFRGLKRGRAARSATSMTGEGLMRARWLRGTLKPRRRATVRGDTPKAQAKAEMPPPRPPLTRFAAGP